MFIIFLYFVLKMIVLTLTALQIFYKVLFYSLK